MGRLLQGQRRVLRRGRFSRRSGEGRRDRRRSSADRRAAAARTVVAGRRPLDLPEFPWDALIPFAERARQHPDGIVDLSVGSPVDPTPQLVRDALAAATDAHSYPATAGSPALREAIVDWYRRGRGAPLGGAQVLPPTGAQEVGGRMPGLPGS